jgi:site-specific DNA-cytosine methylase
LLAISGFPQGFLWPSGELLSLEKCSGVVGNSVNVAVVKCVMQALFGVTEEHKNDEEKEEKD